MRIGIDYRPATSGSGGIAAYTNALVNALGEAFPEDELELYGHRFRKGSAADVTPPSNARLHRSRVPSPALALAARAGLGADRLLGTVDVMHWTDYVRLRTTRAPVVATIHDVLFETLPECYTPAQRNRLADVTRRIVADAQHLVVPSAHARDALIEHFGASEARTHVVPHGVAPLPDAPPADEYGRYVLAVGTLEPRKNHQRLFAAFERLHTREPDLRLVVAGARGWMDSEAFEHMRMRAHIVYEGAVDRERLSALFTGALAVAYPSLGEGFGLPVVEAMSKGCALVVGAGTVCEEVAGEAALAVDPLEESAIHDALEQLVDDEALRDRLAAHGVERAAGYTWQRAAEQTRAVYEEAIG